MKKKFFKSKIEGVQKLRCDFPQARPLNLHKIWKSFFA